MSQNSLVLPTTGTVSGLQQTQNTNNAIDTLNTLASGPSAPSSPEAGQFWHDTTANILKIRSLDNTTWIALFALNETAYTSLPTNLPRNVLSGSITYYVNGSTGNDSNNGLTTGTAFATLQHAANVALSIDTGGQTNNVTISVADGTYAAGCSVNAPLVGGGGLFITGNTGSPGSCIISATGGDCFAFNSGATGTLSGFKVQTTTSGNGINVGQNSSVTMSSFVFGTVPSGYSHMQAALNGILTIAGNYSITGGAGFHMFSQEGGFFGQSAASTITITGTPAFNVFAQSGNLSSIALTSMTYSGSATGTRYAASVNSIIQTNGGGANYFPGNAAGSTSSGGQYV